MGLDFIRRAARTFTKAWDGNKATLAQPTLFSRYPECRSRTIVALLDDGISLTSGDAMAVRVEDGKLVLIHETTQIGVVQEPPSDLLEAIRNAGDFALGRFVQLNPLSGTADVEIE